jgi:hypothetical protein
MVRDSTPATHVGVIGAVAIHKGKAVEGSRGTSALFFDANLDIDGKTVGDFGPYLALHETSGLRHSYVYH